MSATRTKKEIQLTAKTLELHQKTNPTPNYSTLNQNSGSSLMQQESEKAKKNDDANIDIFYNDKKLNIPASNEEIKVMHTLIKPRVKLMINEAKNHPDAFILKTQSYHVADSLKLEIGEKIYKHIKEKIKNSYLMYQ